MGVFQMTLFELIEKTYYGRFHEYQTEQHMDAIGSADTFIFADC
jgi:hypothetical protein